jgi:hypothetical protein
VLLTHPEIADVAVVGVNSQKQATELPRAYIVHAQPDSVKTNAEKLVFADYIQRWIQSKVTRHKFLRGGKMTPLCFQPSDLQLCCRCCSHRRYSKEVSKFMYISGIPNDHLSLPVLLEKYSDASFESSQKRN